jgi:uncharacterized protein (DUF362 family)
MAKFTSIPALPTGGVPYWEQQTLSALKTNIELLLGLINRSDLSAQALLKRNFILTQPGLPQITAITPVSVGAISSTNIAGVNFIITNTGSWNSIPTTLATCGYFEELQKIKADIANIRTTVEAITRKLQGA